MMKQLTVSSLSKHSGLSAQTIRNYADLGLIDVEESAENGYRYFSASSVNQTYAVRRLSELGFSMAEVQEIMQPPAPERYGDMLDALYQKTQREIQYEQDVLRMLSIHQESLQGFQNSLNCGRIISGGTFYCLDYTRNREKLLPEVADIVREWIRHSGFLRTYSPFPVAALSSDTPEQRMGLIVPEQFAKYFPLDAPVYRRSAERYAAFFIENDDHMNILHDGKAHMVRFLQEHNLSIVAEPFFIGNVPLEVNRRKTFYATMYSPV